MKTNHKTQIALVTILSSLTFFTPSLAATYQCVLPARDATDIKKIPHGNWGPQHNTRKWSYAPINGRDIFRHRNGNRTVGTRCQKNGPGGYNYGTHRIDYDGGLQDYCVETTPAHPERIATPMCSSGYTLSTDHGTCTRPSQAGYWQKTRKPKGNWGPQHNTSKWSYSTVNGSDIYRHRNGKRTIGTRCQKGAPGAYNYGTHKIDMDGVQDYCATWRQPISASSTRASCNTHGTGFKLQQKSNDNASTVSTEPNSGSNTLITPTPLEITRPMKRKIQPKINRKINRKKVKTIQKSPHMQKKD